MKTSTVAALLAYLEALKDEGFKSLHLSMVLPMNHPMSNLERRQNGLDTWTQFPDLAGSLPKGMFYDRISGWLYFSEEAFLAVQPY